MSAPVSDDVMATLALPPERLWLVVSQSRHGQPLMTTHASRNSAVKAARRRRRDGYVVRTWVIADPPWLTLHDADHADEADCRRAAVVSVPNDERCSSAPGPPEVSRNTAAPHCAPMSSPAR